MDKLNSIACSNEDQAVRDVEGKCDVSILSVAATDQVAGYERKGYYNTVQNPKAHATKPVEKEVSSLLMLQKINIEDSLIVTKKNCQPSYLNTKLILPKNQGNATAWNVDSSCKVECRSPERADQYHLHYVKKCKNKLKHACRSHY